MNCCWVPQTKTYSASLVMSKAHGKKSKVDYLSSGVCNAWSTKSEIIDQKSRLACYSQTFEFPGGPGYVCN